MAASVRSADTPFGKASARSGRIVAHSDKAGRIGNDKSLACREWSVGPNQGDSTFISLCRAVGSDHGDPSSIAKGSNDTDQKVAGYVFQIVIQDCSHSGARRARPIGNLRVRDPLLTRDFLQALEQHVLHGPFLCRGGAESLSPGQLFWRRSDDRSHSMHGEAPSNVSCPAQFREAASVGSF